MNQTGVGSTVESPYYRVVRRRGLFWNNMEVYLMWKVEIIIKKLTNTHCFVIHEDRRTYCVPDTQVQNNTTCMSKSSFRVILNSNNMKQWRMILWYTYVYAVLLGIICVYITLLFIVYSSRVLLVQCFRNSKMNFIFYYYFLGC